METPTLVVFVNQVLLLAKLKCRAWGRGYLLPIEVCDYGAVSDNPIHAIANDWTGLTVRKGGLLDRTN